MHNKHFMVSAILLAITIALLPISSAMAHDFSLPGGTTPGEDPPPDPPTDPPCDPTPPGTCSLNRSPTNPNKSSCTGGEPVYLFDGSFYYRHTDLTIPGRIPISIRRSYDIRSDFKGLMGYGWSMNYHIRLFTLADGNLLLKRGDNSKTEFTQDTGDTYIAEEGYETILANGNGTFTLNRTDGYFYQFDIDGTIESIDDKNGNQLLFSYYSDPNGIKWQVPFSGISPFALVNTPITLGYDFQLERVEEAHNGIPTGRYIAFTYNANGRIEMIEDFTGRQVTYEYDPTANGDLISMTDPEQNIYQYGYDNEHLMTSFVGLGCGECTLHTNIYNASKQVIQPSCLFVFGQFFRVLKWSKCFCSNDGIFR